MFTDRKSSYKLPPTTIRDKLISQEARRNKALEDQKRRRAQRVDSARQLDLFAGLNLGGSDDEDDDIPEEDESGVAVAPSSVAQYAGLLDRPSDTMDAQDVEDGHHVANAAEPGIEVAEQAVPFTKKKHGKKRKNKRRTTKPSKWADKCMYAELLEMVSDDQLWATNSVSSEEIHDGLPRDLENGWVAVAPVPAGKRCLAVTHQSAGVVGISPNTTLSSRLLGKTLINRFPSSLPPLTILDCILDENWRDNGILHVLDVLKWKGQDVADCEAGFRFWWRDTRLAELTQTYPPSTASHRHFVPVNNPSDAPDPNVQSIKYRFPYPTNFIPIPFHTNTSLISFCDAILPAATTIREIDVVVPAAPPSDDESVMDVEVHLPTSSFTFQAPTATDNSFFHPAPQPPLSPPSSMPSSDPPSSQAPPAMKHQTAQIQSDGLLLYVAEASYEHGTSPLSSWVPIVGYDDQEQTEDKTMSRDSLHPLARQAQVENGPLALFHRLILKRLAKRTSSATVFSSNDVEMEV